MIAYKLDSLRRRVVKPRPISNWSLTSLPQRLVRIGGRLVRLARYYLVALGEEPSHAAALDIASAEI